MEVHHTVIEWVTRHCGRAPPPGAGADDASLTAEELARVAAPPLYFINLARRPDRAAHMRRELDKTNATARFDVRRFDAFDAIGYEFSTDEV